MQRKNLLKLGAASTAAAICTIAAGVGVWAAGQANLTATDNVAFVADRYVDAKVTAYDKMDIASATPTTTTFVSTEIGRSTKEYTTTWANISGDTNYAGRTDTSAWAGWWTDNTDTTDSAIDAYTIFTVTVENTSDVDDNVLSYTIANTFAQPTSGFDGTVAVDAASKTGKLAKGEKADVEFRFDIDGKFDLAAVETNWTVTLTAAKAN